MLWYTISLGVEMNSIRRTVQRSTAWLTATTNRIFGRSPNKAAPESIAGESTKSEPANLVALPEERHLRFMLEHNTLVASDLAATFGCSSFDADQTLAGIFARAVQQSYSNNMPLREVQVNLSYLGRRKAKDNIRRSIKNPRLRELFRYEDSSPASVLLGPRLIDIAKGAAEFYQVPLEA